MKPTDKPTVPQVLPIVQALYRVHLAGCCLHIVLDDYNVEDQSVEFCIEVAERDGHQLCADLARLLLRMSRTQRKKLAQKKREPAADTDPDQVWIGTIRMWPDGSYSVGPAKRAQ